MRKGLSFTVKILSEGDLIMFKKLLSVLLTFAMLLSMVPAVFAVEAEPMGITEGDNTVTIRIIGSSVPEKKPSISSSKYDYGGAQYQNWLKTTTYKVADGTTVKQLLEQVWGFEYFGDSRTVDVHIKRIREKVCGNDEWNIKTVWGIGYKFEVEE